MVMHPLPMATNVFHAWQITYLIIYQWQCITMLLKKLNIGQWLCGSVGRAVASDTRGPRFESSHQQKFTYIEHLCTVNCVLKSPN